MGLGYGKHDGEFSKAKEAHEAVHGEWKILTPTLQEDVNNHAANENVKEEDFIDVRIIIMFIDVWIILMFIYVGRRYPCTLKLSK